MGWKQDLKSLAQAYIYNKEVFEEYKKLVDDANKQIKKIFSIHLKDGDFISVDGKKVIYSIQKRESMNEAKLLDIAHRYGIPEIIKTKEYIDFDALENALYNEKLSAEIIDKIAATKETKEVETLRIVKEKKNDI